MKSKKLIGLLMLALMSCAVSEATVGFKTVITSAGVTKIKDIIVPIVQPQIVGLTIPNMSGTTGTPIGIDISYTLTDVKISTFSFGASTATLLPGVGVGVEMTGTTCTLDMNWSYTSNVFISGSGSAVDSLTMTIGVDFALSDNGGKPYMTVTAVSVDITSIDITVSGGASWFYQVMVDIFTSKIKSVIQSAIQSEMGVILNTVANHFLAEMTVDFDLYNFLQVDYSLASNPDVFATYSVTQHTGSMATLNAPISVCFPNASLPDVTSSQPVNFLLSTEMGNCILQLLYKSNEMTFEITPSLVPSNSPVKLWTNDSNIENLIPGLNKDFPNSPINIGGMVIQAPTNFINSTANGAMYQVDLIANFGVQPVVNAVPELAFEFQCNTSVQSKLSFSGNKILAEVDNIYYTCELLDTKVGAVDMNGVVDLVNFFVAFGVKPQLNALGADGLPIPTVSGVELVNSALSYSSNYFLVETDFNYIGSASLTRSLQARHSKRRSILIQN